MKPYIQADIDIAARTIWGEARGERQVEWQGAVDHGWGPEGPLPDGITLTMPEESF